MITVKTSRKFKLQEDEEDSLLAGVDFQTRYLGTKDLEPSGCDIDYLVEDVYSRYLTNEDLKKAASLTITVDSHQLVLSNAASNEDLAIAVADIKSVHSGTKKNKFPNAVILVTSPLVTPSRAHVLHCSNQRKARELYQVIERAFEYNQGEKILKHTGDEELERSSKLLNGASHITNDIENNTAATTKSGRSQPRHTSPNSSSDNKNEEEGSDIATQKVARKIKGVRQTRVDDEMSASQGSPDASQTRSKGRAKSSSQIRGTESLGLLENIDPEEGFDDDFTKFARSRSLSETIKGRFGR